MRCVVNAADGGEFTRPAAPPQHDSGEVTFRIVGTPRTEPDGGSISCSKANRRQTMGKGPMRPAQYPILERIGKVLHEQLSDVAREPLPERWTDLIHYLS